MDVERPEGTRNPRMGWGSDAIAQTLNAMGFEHVSLTPGASFRGLHDSLVNFLGNRAPQLLLCVHEEHAVALAHGWAKVTGRPMAVALHSNVGLMHATMAIFNAWCDRVPMLILGAQGPLDATKRRPWVDWLHTTSDLPSLVRGYTKWDDQPTSVGATLESLLRANVIACTAPAGPVYVCLDAGVQEQELNDSVVLPHVARFQPGQPAAPNPAMVKAAADLLATAARPLILAGRSSRDEAAWSQRIALAEAITARVVTDLRVGAAFPTRHRLHPHAPGLFIDDAAAATIRAADVVLSLDFVDLAGTLTRAWGGAAPTSTIIHCSVDQYAHNGWGKDHLGLPPVDIPLLASPDATVPLLLAALEGRGREGRVSWPPATIHPPPPSGTGATAESAGLPVARFAEVVAGSLRAHRPSYIRLPIGWPGRLCDFDHPLSYLGFDGGGGIGGGPGMAVGAALALRGSDRLPVAVVGDGDFLMGVTALWTAVHYRVPLLMVVANNTSFFNDELHQDRVARQRSRPAENRWIGQRMSDPDFDIGMLARAQGAVGLGPARTDDELTARLAEAIATVKSGGVAVIDARVLPEYDRATSSGVLRPAASAD
ncbi:MAG: thiamine pyrophosphate-binding protein [Alphaproteobacteria bacterium]|nr:thiamine pyrophosphate-binding protein [Alphaproteobacteria bacterium]